MIFLLLVSFVIGFVFPVVAETAQPEIVSELPFAVGVYAYAPVSGVLFMGAQETCEKNDRALAYALHTRLHCTPLAPEKVHLDGHEQENPLYGAAIASLSLLDGKPVVAKAGDNRVYYFAHYDADPKAIRLFSSPLLHDATGVPGEVVAVLGGRPLTDKGPLYFCAAVKPAQGTFGDPGSGIAVCFAQEKKKENGVAFVVSSTDFSAAKPFEGNRAIALDMGSSFVMVAGVRPVCTRGPVLFFDHILERWYIGFGARGAAGARGLVMGALTYTPAQAKKANKPAVPVLASACLSAVMPEAAIGGDGIISAPADVSVTLYMLASLYTSTGLSYLVVQGGAGDPEATHHKVYALPLVNSGVSMGMIARKGQMPEDSYKEDFFDHRSFLYPVETREDMTTCYDAAACVGGGDAPGKIVTMWVRNDAIFVVTEKNAGIFSSRAIFDAQGRIAGWTAWQPAGGVQGAITYAAYDVAQAHFLYAVQKNAGIRVASTHWHPTEKHPLSRALKDKFHDKKQPFKRLLTFAPDTLAFSQIPGSRIALIACLGRGKVVLCQTGDDRSGVFTSHVVTKEFSGGVLDELGALLSAAFVTRGGMSWLVVGGAEGLAVLAHPDGSGFPVLGSGLAALVGMRFFKLGNYAQVHTLCAQGSHLFVATNRVLDECAFDAESVRARHIESHRLASAQTTVPYFDVILDCLVYGENLVLATNTGLFYADAFARTIQWYVAPMPYAVGGPTRLVPVFPAVRGGIWNLYVENNATANDQCRLYRYVFDPSEGVMCLFPDIILKSTGRGYLIDFGYSKRGLSADGAAYFVLGLSPDKKVRMVELVGEGVRSGSLLQSQLASHHILLFKKSLQSSPVVYDYATGARIVWGDNNLHVNA